MDKDISPQDLMVMMDRSLSLPAKPGWVDEAPRVLIAGVDTIHFSYDLMVSEETWADLLCEQEQARLIRKQRRAVYVSTWLNAQVSPMGANGYPILIVTNDFAIRLQTGNKRQPGIFVEMRSLALHTHPDGVIGACNEAVRFLQEKVFADQPDILAGLRIERSRCSRFDAHLDWQGGWHPTLDEAEKRLFIRPARSAWNPFMEGTTCLGYVIGKKRIMARIYNKTAQIKKMEQATKEDITWYSELLTTRAGSAYNPEQDVWRLEFELKHEGIKGFELVTEQEETDPDEVLEAEMEGEDLPTIGSVPKALYWVVQMWDYLTRRWLRLVEPGKDMNRARWATHPTWRVLQQGFANAYDQAPLTETNIKLVRAQQHSGYRRGLQRMLTGILTSAELLLDSDPASVLPGFLKGVMRQAQAAQKVQERKRSREVDERHQRYTQQVEHLAQMALGVCTSIGVTKGDLPPFTHVADLLEYLCDDLEAIARTKGGMGQMLYDKWCKVYKTLPIPQSLMSHYRVA